MTLHLIKLCVGCDSVEDLDASLDRRRRQAARSNRTATHCHVTRMVPRRGSELLDGGSLYWVIKGAVQARQRLLDVQPFVDSEGVGRCRLVMEPRLTATEWQPRRPFQGWRYLTPEDAPPDLSGGRVATDLPPALRAELAGLGLM